MQKCTLLSNTRTDPLKHVNRFEYIVYAYLCVFDRNENRLDRLRQGATCVDGSQMFVLAEICFGASVSGDRVAGRVVCVRRWLPLA